MTYIDWHTCTCGKRAYHHKRDAKTIRRHIGDTTMSVYRRRTFGLVGRA